MFRHPSIKFVLLILAAALLRCEHNERESTQRLVLDVRAGYSLQPNEYNAFRLTSLSKYQIVAPGSAISIDSATSAFDSALAPTYLQITFDQEGNLAPSLLRALGYKVTTRFEFDESSITVNHTNVADSLFVAPGDSLGDTLYIAIRGEGLVSGGEKIFENVSGFFYEQSTFQVVHDTVLTINCRYELTVDY